MNFSIFFLALLGLIISCFVSLNVITIVNEKMSQLEIKIPDSPVVKLYISKPDNKKDEVVIRCNNVK